MLERVQVLPVVDGGNPRSEYEITREETAFLIRPFIEDGDPIYKFHLLVSVVNDSDAAVSVCFRIEWGDLLHQPARQFLLLSVSDDHWEKHEAVQQGTRIVAKVEVPPGRSFLCMHPRYDYGRFLNHLDSLPRDRFQVRSIGKSRRNRDLAAIEAGQAAARPLVVITRVHPYETVGSYFVEGMLDWLKGDGEDVQAMHDNNRIIFLPMPNPDGVAEGLAKTNLGGLDFSYAMASCEPEAVAVKAFLTDVNALAVFDLHGFMMDHDRFRTNYGPGKKALHERWSSMPELFNKPLHAFHEAWPPNGKEVNTGGYVVQELGGCFINSSWTWFDRDADHLRAIGVELLKGFAEIYRTV